MSLLILDYIFLVMLLGEFLYRTEFSYSKYLNYRLNFIIATLILLTLSLAFRLYVVPLF